jgi:hypothetical protein
MPRNNKVTERVFADIAETGRKKGTYDKFLSIDQEMGIQESAMLQLMKKRYAELAHEHAEDLKNLAALEEIIIQLRCKEVINSEIRLSLSRNYIYARSLFYRRSNQINDIRIVVGKTEEYGEDLNTLFNDIVFMQLAKDKLREAMDKEVQKNIEILTQIITV